MACLCFKAVVKWLESYLSSSKFSVSLGNIFSRAALLICGVPQVSLWFWSRYDSWYELMVFPQSLWETGSHIHHDDTCISCKDKDIRKIEVVLTKEFYTLCAWFGYNKLSINFWENKAKCILFSKTRYD